MAATVLPSQEYLRECFLYDPETGALTWRARPRGHFRSDARLRTWNTAFSGKPALSAVSGTGYRHGMLDMVGAKAHRVIWKMMTGADPDQIDHVNGVKTDNRWANLRDVDYPENSRNLARATNNTSGVTGVGWNRSARRWRAYIKSGGKNIHVGHFVLKDDAIAARKEAERRFGFHPNHGRAA